MYDIKRILVPIDDSELSKAALPIAASLAKHYDASILLVTVVETTGAEVRFASGSGHPVGTGMAPEFMEETIDALHESARQALDQASDMLRGQDVRVETLMPEGSATSVVTDVALAEKPDLIAIASHARAGLSRTFMGSLADHLVRETEIPVLIVTAESAPQTA